MSFFQPLIRPFLLPKNFSRRFAARPGQNSRAASFRPKQPGPQGVAALSQNFHAGPFRPDAAFADSHFYRQTISVIGPQKRKPVRHTGNYRPHSKMRSQKSAARPAARRLGVSKPVCRQIQLPHSEDSGGEEHSLKQSTYPAGCNFACRPCITAKRGRQTHCRCQSPLPRSGIFSHTNLPYSGKIQYASSAQPCRLAPETVLRLNILAPAILDMRHYQ